jgi:hypothetical protein
MTGVCGCNGRDSAEMRCPEDKSHLGNVEISVLPAASLTDPATLVTGLLVMT